jgi:hypothetical protein
MAQMTARFAGKCAKTGAPIRPGDMIDYDRRTRRATLLTQPAIVGYSGVLYDIVEDVVVERSDIERASYTQALEDARALIDYRNAELAAEESDAPRANEEPTPAAPAEGRYVSDVFRTSGGTFYRNKRGRCEDAPACGCCTI